MDTEGSSLGVVGHFTKASLLNSKEQVSKESGVGQITTRNQGLNHWRASLDLFFLHLRKAVESAARYDMKVIDGRTSIDGSFGKYL